MLSCYLHILFFCLVMNIYIVLFNYWLCSTAYAMYNISSFRNVKKLFSSRRRIWCIPCRRLCTGSYSKANTKGLWYYNFSWVKRGFLLLFYFFILLFELFMDLQFMDNFMHSALHERMIPCKFAWWTLTQFAGDESIFLVWDSWQTVSYMPCSHGWYHHWGWYILVNFKEF
jgi:hypothetical protein